MKNPDIFYYPAVFTPDEGGAFMVTFPDIEARYMRKSAREIVYRHA
jgi:hypothetical protein